MNWHMPKRTYSQPFSLIEIRRETIVLCSKHIVNPQILVVLTAKRCSSSERSSAGVDLLNNPRCHLSEGFKWAIHNSLTSSLMLG